MKFRRILKTNLMGLMDPVGSCRNLTGYCCCSLVLAMGF